MLLSIDGTSRLGVYGSCASGVVCASSGAAKKKRSRSARFIAAQFKCEGGAERPRPRNDSETQSDREAVRPRRLVGILVRRLPEVHVEDRVRRGGEGVEGLRGHARLDDVARARRGLLDALLVEDVEH